MDTYERANTTNSAHDILGLLRSVDYGAQASCERVIAAVAMGGWRVPHPPARAPLANAGGALRCANVVWVTRVAAPVTWKHLLAQERS